MSFVFSTKLLVRQQKLFDKIVHKKNARQRFFVRVRNEVIHKNCVHVILICREYKLYKHSREGVWVTFRFWCWN